VEIRFGLFHKYIDYKQRVVLDLDKKEYESVKEWMNPFGLFFCLLGDNDAKFTVSNPKIICTFLDAMEFDYTLEDEVRKDGKVSGTLKRKTNLDRTYFFRDFPISAPMYIQDHVIFRQCKHAKEILKDDSPEIYIDIDVGQEDMSVLFKPKYHNLTRESITKSIPVQSFNKVMEVCEYFGIEVIP